MSEEEENQAGAHQRLTGSNEEWKEKFGYHLRSLVETAMLQIKMIYGERLSLHDYDVQVSGAMARVKVLNKMTLLD